MTRTARILIVDDESTNRMLLKSYLQSCGTVEEAINGVDACSMIEHARSRGEPFDVMFLDILMPEKNGQEVLAEVRARELELGIVPGEGLKIVMVTALDDESQVFESHISGCDGYVVKPFTREQILELLESFEGEKAR